MAGNRPRERRLILGHLYRAQDRLDLLSEPNHRFHESFVSQKVLCANGPWGLIFPTLKVPPNPITPSEPLAPPHPECYTTVGSQLETATEPPLRSSETLMLYVCTQRADTLGVQLWSSLHLPEHASLPPQAPGPFGMPEEYDGLDAPGHERKGLLASESQA